MTRRILITASAAVASAAAFAFAAHGQTVKPLTNPAPSTLIAPSGPAAQMSGSTGVKVETGTLTSTMSPMVADAKPGVRVPLAPLSANATE